MLLSEGNTGALAVSSFITSLQKIKTVFKNVYFSEHLEMAELRLSYVIAIPTDTNFITSEAMEDHVLEN